MIFHVAVQLLSHKATLLLGHHFFWLAAPQLCAWDDHIKYIPLFFLIQRKKSRKDCVKQSSLKVFLKNKVEQIFLLRDLSKTKVFPEILKLLCTI